jgi:asparagine synthase (glutamine-hydrolysing)
MCGIAGILDLRGSAVDARPLPAMAHALAHRGPDGECIWSEGPVAFGHARLAIIDLSTGGQPMANPAGTLEIVFNGEIFNYVELRRELEAAGHRFATTSDTEVILHAYEEHGESCVEHLNGQWAFAIWDKRKRKLFATRDRVGICPLYYTVADRQLLFASEMKALLAHPEVSRGLDPIGLDQIFTFWAPLAPRTAFKGISQLPPGSSLRAVDGEVTTWRWWSFDYAVDPSLTDEAACAEELLALLVDATRLRLRADVPTAAYLSGGLDSSLILSLIKNYTDTPLRSFSVTFDDPEFDESRFQEQVIGFLGTAHSSVRCRHGDIGRMFPDVIWHAESPVIRTAPAPLFMLSKLVREHRFKVVLTGEGSDEMLGGYDIFKEAKIRRFWGARPDSALRPLLLSKLYPWLKNLQAQSPSYRQAFFHVRKEDLESPFFSHLPRWEMTHKLEQFYSREMREATRAHDPYADVLAALPSDFSRWDPFARAQWLEATILLPGYILASQGDRMTMGHSVEGRFPFLDHRVIELAGRLSPRMKMKVLDEKHLLKVAARGLVPPQVLARPKQPYRAPDGVSLLGDASAKRPEWVDRVLDRERLAASGLWNPVAVEKLVAKFEKGRAIGIRDNMSLVGVLSSELVVDQFINRSRS